MGKDSKIEWTHHTFNIVWGCAKVSPACKNCYAESFAKRTGHDVWGLDGKRRVFGEKHWAEPLKWNRDAEQAGERRRVFCSSMADVFEDHPTLAKERPKLWPLIESTPWLDWMLLTKRPENMRSMLPLAWRAEPRSNVWLGTTVEDQEWADRRIPHLLNTAAAIRFLSAEPLLGPVTLPENWLALGDLVICGGESGHHSRPMHEPWAVALRDQCVAAGMAFHFKQWGEHDSRLVRIGKKDAGRILDGRTWDEMPRAV